MQSNGNGVVFSESDHVMCQRLIGLINQTRFNLDPKQIVEGAESLIWLRSQLLPAIVANIMEIKRIVDTRAKDAPVATQAAEAS